MTLNTASRKFKKVLLILVVVMAFLAACTPAETVTPEPALTEEVITPSTPTIMVTALPTSTPLPSPTPTVTLSPEEAAQAEQAAIRAEVLSYGIDLDDLAHSENEYIRNHPSVESFQEELNNNFKSGKAGTELMVMLDLEQLHSADEYEKSVTTDGGWKFIVWVKVAYKDAGGNWQIAAMPLMAYHEDTETMWLKFAQPTQPWLENNYAKKETVGWLKFEGEHSTAYLISHIYEGENYYLNIGALFRLDTNYPDPDSRLNAGEVGETPRYSQEELAYFWQTGDPSIFEYQTLDGTYVIWPFVTSSTVTTKDYQPIQ